MTNTVFMNVNKLGLAGYVGFGEQSGRTVLKKPTFMNYFCYDNYNYTKVYGKGALDPKEPLWVYIGATSISITLAPHS